MLERRCIASNLPAHFLRRRVAVCNPSISYEMEPSKNIIFFHGSDEFS